MVKNHSLHQMRIINDFRVQQTKRLVKISFDSLDATLIRYGSEPPMSNGIIRFSKSQLPSFCLSITGRRRSSFAGSCPLENIPADCRLIFCCFSCPCLLCSTFRRTLPAVSACWSYTR